MSTILRRALKRLIPWRSVRRELGTVEFALRRAFRGTRNELFARNRLIRSEGYGARVNVGCGDLIAPGWLNLDANPADGAHYVDVRNGLPFDDSSVRHIHCEHFLEHLDFSDAKGLLVEFHRVLTSDGTLRLIVPDAEKYCCAYAHNDTQYFKKLEDLGGVTVPFETPMQIINQMFRMEGAHRYSWDFATVSAALEDAGFFTSVRSFQHDVRAELDIDGSDWWREIESLYVNASKSEGSW